MSSLLMLDSDSSLVAAVTHALSQERLEVVSAESVHEALDKLTRHTFDAALLDGDLIALEELTAFSQLPVILTTSFPDHAGVQRFSPEARVLRKPFTNAELLSALHAVCDTLEASASSLVDVLRRAHSGGQSVALRVGDALVFVEQGELVHAELAGVRGERALSMLLAQPRSQPVAVPGRASTRTIQRPFRSLMLDLLRKLDEQEQRSADHGEER